VEELHPTRKTNENNKTFFVILFIYLKNISSFMFKSTLKAKKNR